VIQTYPGYYEVDGDKSSNDINISVSQAAAQFTLNGATYSNVSYITVNANGPADQVSVVSDDEYGSIGGAVNGGGGNETISVSGLSAVIHGGAGNDTLSLKDSIYGEVYGDGGSDNITVSGDCFDAQIQGGSAGGNLIDASQSNSAVVIYGGSGNDTLYGSSFDDQLYGEGGSDVMYGIGGNDTFYSTGGVIYGSSDGTNVAYVPTGSYVACYNIQYVYKT
jgi:Ca2+-binding RTX toxin-like protein